jgi:hypothetical protein
MDALLLLEQFSSYMTEDHLFVAFMLLFMVPILETDAQVKVLLFIAFMLLLVDVLPMLEQCSSIGNTDVCSKVRRSLKLR